MRAANMRKHGEEEEAGVAQDLLGFVPNPQVEQANEEANADVDVIRRCVRTWAGEIHTQVCKPGGGRQSGQGDQGPQRWRSSASAPSLQEGGSQPALLRPVHCRRILYD